MENLANKDPYLQGKNIVVALSGGLDSVVLLHYLHAHYSKNLRAIHINHHLSKSCFKWGEFCKNLCKNLNIDYLNIDISIENKANIEENARKKRYQMLADNLAKNDILCTAHHQNDQAETLLLQLFRGAGVAGLAAMPASKPLGDGIHYRPFLDIEKSELLKYAKQNQLDWVEDDSNTDTRFRRNFLRLKITPTLSEVYKNLTKTLSRCAKHQAQALHLMQDLARIDIQKHQLLDKNRLKISGLILLDVHRVKNIIRYHLNTLNFTPPADKVMTQIIQLLSSKIDATPLVSWSEYEVRSYRDALYFINKRTYSPPPCKFYTQLKDLPNFSIRYRTESQRIKLPNKNHSQSLKKVLQESEIPPWERDKLRMYYINNKLKAMERIGKMSD